MNAKKVSLEEERRGAFTENISHICYYHYDNNKIAAIAPYKLLIPSSGEILPHPGPHKCG
jgi:hypothetical protein